MPKKRRISKRSVNRRMVPIDLDYDLRGGMLRVDPRPKHAVIVFGDEVDFRAWEGRRHVSDWESHNHIRRLYKEFRTFRNGNWIKPMGDGFLSVMELSGEAAQKGAQVLEIFERAGHLMGKLKDLSSKGFRIRMTSGYVGRLEVSYPKESQVREVDYTGIPISDAFNLLHVDRGKTFVCDERVKEILHSCADANSKVKFHRLQKPEQKMKHFSKSHIGVLWSFQIIA